MKFLQTKPQVKSMNINYYELYYTVNKTSIDEENENYEISDDLFKLFILNKWREGMKVNQILLSKKELKDKI